MKANKFLPKQVVAYFQMFGIALVLLSITRIIFFFANYASFEAWVFKDFIVGIWFDIISVSLLSLPLFVWTNLPMKKAFKESLVHKIIQYFLFLVLVVGILAFNLMDVEYFKFTSKRSTVDLFSILGAGNDFNQLVFSFIKDFWLLILCFILLLILSIITYNKTIGKREITEVEWTKDSISFVAILGLLIILGRGGVGLRPAGILSAAQYTSMQKTALVLNTPFTMIKSYGKKGFTKKNYFTEDEISRKFSPNYPLMHAQSLPENTNVVVLILESFGKEWIGPKYTPFLDSLMQESLYFNQAFANGKKSIEAMPSIFAGIPSWSDNPYISSPYGDNNIATLITALSKKGYSSAFYHGATNGSMRFDEFSSLAGFQHYYGRNEYPNPEHFDGTWGILDEFFNPWAAKKMSELSQPFVTGLFTLSSHHPYYIPEAYEDQIPPSKYPIARSVAYGDISLRKFFEQAQKETWYNNTLFVLVADHTPSGSSSYYKHRIGMYQIPIVFFHPQKLLGTGLHPQIMDQIDIYPSLMDVLTKDKAMYAFGQSYADTNNAEALYYLEGTYMYLKNGYMLSFSQDEAKALYNYQLDTLARHDSLRYYPQIVEEMTEDIKARIQVYNNDILSNQMKLEDE
ncbi:LTA synthase family protein [Lishizhenia sp.]|uniref:LTA synthase family protein n=1 Tax=Lishizhenia sp. TaxID=2497594 RepID=UPI00299E6BDE|nr:sulfatase-like hydrolase/transferase [Lishizhenia sp.]MDX1446656.1 sulfatase-like hydrolase/transferase [Lishizhenia sp.]